MFLFHSLQVLADGEAEVSNMFNKVKQWSDFYSNEMVLWGKLHTSLQRHIMAEFQLEMGLIKQAEESSSLYTSSSW